MNILAPTDLIEELKIDCSVSMSLRFAIRTHVEANNKFARLECVSNKQEQLGGVEKKIIDSRVSFKEFSSEGIEEVIIKLGDEYNEKELRTVFVLEANILKSMFRSIRIQYVGGNISPLVDFHFDRVIGRDISVISFDKKGEENVYIERITGQQLALPKISMENIEKVSFNIEDKRGGENRASKAYLGNIRPEYCPEVKTYKKWRRRG